MNTLTVESGCNYFSKFDLSKGYWQVPMKESYKNYTAFTTHRGLFRFMVRPMPFGLVNAPATFSRKLLYDIALWLFIKSVVFYIALCQTFLTYSILSLLFVSFLLILVPWKVCRAMLVHVETVSFFCRFL